ncbi:GAS8-like protein, putative [Plasmodium ovale]|uniref:GAS8-like protein, putative n=1 Tax=Plasmodium ovale TaxID=36330 RepID=A0A1D3TJD9_PLAOA|nr:GAS8-like protein, putative [Plasmodium ovale]
MKKGQKKISARKKEEKETLIREVNKLNDDINEEHKKVEDIDSRIRNIDANIFLGYHDIKMLKLELKNKEVEMEENRCHKLMSSRNIENTINRHVLKCYESFLHNLAAHEEEIYGHTNNHEEEKRRQLSHRDYDKLTTVTNTRHLDKLNSILLSQNEMIDEINRRFLSNLVKIKEDYSKKINLEREKYDKKRQNLIFSLQKEKNDNIKNILEGHNKNILNIQTYFRLILDDQLDIIHKLEDDKLGKKKNFLLKKKKLDELKKSISSHGKKLAHLEKDVALLKINVVDYEKLKMDLQNIKEKKKKQQKVLTELKLETNVKKMLFVKLSKEYDDLYNKNRMKLYTCFQKILLENHFLETQLKLQSETMEMRNFELEKWKESIDPAHNEVLNNALRNKFHQFEALKKEVEELMDADKKNRENYEAIMHLNYFAHEDLDILKRESVC